MIRRLTKDEVREDIYRTFTAGSLGSRTQKLQSGVFISTKDFPSEQIQLLIHLYVCANVRRLKNINLIWGEVTDDGATLLILTDAELDEYKEQHPYKPSKQQTAVGKAMAEFGASGEM